MTDLTNQQKREWAKVLYIREDLTQAEIAEKVGVSRRTIISWCDKGKWAELKVGMTMTREQQINNLHRQIAEINQVISAKPEGKRFADASEAATIQKLSQAVDRLEKDAGLKDLISSGMRFLSWLRSEDIEKAKEFGVLWDTSLKPRYEDGRQRSVTQVGKLF